MASLAAVKAAAVALFKHSEKRFGWDDISAATRRAWLERARIALEAAEKTQKRIGRKAAEAKEQANAGSVR